MKRLSVICSCSIFLLFPYQVMASTATAKAESIVNESQVSQSVEVTVNGQTIKKESNQPGKLEVKIDEKVTSSIQTVTTPSPTIKMSITPVIVTPSVEVKAHQATLFEPLINFFKNILSLFKRS